MIFTATGAGTGTGTASGAHIINWRHFYVIDDDAFVGAVDTQYGLNIDDLTSAGTNWGIWVQANNCHFGGDVELNGHLTFNVTARGLKFKTGSAQRVGNATLVGGTVTVTNGGVSVNTIIYLSRKTLGGTVGNLSYVLNAGANFVINSSSASDTSVVSYMLVELNP